MNAAIVRVGAEVGLGSPDPIALTVSGRLFVETIDGRRLHATGGAVGAKFGGGRADDPVTRRDVEDAINRLLGRDPTKPRPPRLAWDQLSDVLDREGIAMTEDELIGKPFVFEFSDELLAELLR